jgi:hypothetical protein
MQGHGPEPELEAIRKLRVEKRYVWRVASAMRWAFADFDDLSVEADKLSLTPEDFARVVELLKLRPIQFCIFLKALVGAGSVYLFRAGMSPTALVDVFRCAGVSHQSEVSSITPVRRKSKKRFSDDR